MDGIINIYKEKGYTSHDVVSIVKRLLGAKKAGHAGTLDPDAEGVLVILLGKATKLSDYLMNGNKEYRASVKFGSSTATYDAAGEITAKGIADFTESSLKQAVSEFIGEQMQVPPMYSAIKSGGKKLYDLARKGVEIEREARKITIFNIYVEQFNGFDEAVIYIKCGKGTYVRSVCHDLGQKLGCGAHMSGLTRTKAGGLNIENAVKLSRLKEIIAEGGLNSLLLPLETAFEGFNKITVPKHLEKPLYNGSRMSADLLRPGQNAVLSVLYDEKGNLIGVYETVTGGDGARFLKPKTMLL